MSCAHPCMKMLYINPVLMRQVKVSSWRETLGIMQRLSCTAKFASCWPILALNANKMCRLLNSSIAILMFQNFMTHSWCNKLNWVLKPMISENGSDPISASWAHVQYVGTCWHLLILSSDSRALSSEPCCYERTSHHHLSRLCIIPTSALCTLPLAWTLFINLMAH